MQIANQQRLIIGVSIVAVVALIVTTIWSRPSFFYQPPTEQQLQTAKEQQDKQLAEYRQYLKDIEADPAASYQVIKNTIDYKQLQRQVVADLGVNKPAFVPLVDATKFHVTDDASAEALKTYTTKATAIVADFSNTTADTWSKVFGDTPDPIVARGIQQKISTAIADMYNLEVPRSAVALHTSALKTLQINSKLVGDAVRSMTVAVAPRGEGKWVNSYAAFQAADKEIDNLHAAADALNKQYGYESMPEAVTVGFGVKVAHAQVPVQIVVDYPRLFEQMLRDAMGQVILNYIKNQILNWVIRFDKDHTIANFLYYNDALSNKYSDDYISKYASADEGFDDTDRAMVKQLLPQFSCGRLDETTFKKQTRAKVLIYLGFDPQAVNSLDINDPDYYAKLSKTATLRGDTSGQGYALFVQSLSAVTQATGQQSSLIEQLSPGKKAGYSADGAQRIVESVDLVSGKISAAINTLFHIAPSNATTGGPGWSAVVTGIMTSILTQLVVQGTVTLKEQSACIKTPVYNPVLPGDFTPSGTDPNQQNIAQCMANPDKCRDLIFANPNGTLGVGTIRR